MQNKPVYLYITPCFPSPESWRGGFCYDAVCALMRDGRYDVRVITTGVGDDYDYGGVHVYRFPKPQLGCSDYFPFLTERAKVRCFRKKLQAMGLQPKDIAVCHVHLFEVYSVYAVWLKRQNPHCLTLLHHHWTGAHSLSQGRLGRLPLLTELLYLWYRYQYESVDAHIFCSEATKRGFARIYPHGITEGGLDMRYQLLCPSLFRAVQLKDSYVAYNGIDSRLFYPMTKLGRTSQTFRIGCVANFIPAKSQITLIRALEKIRQEDPTANIHVDFVGSGGELENCQRYVAEKGLGASVAFVQEMGHDRLPDFYRSLDLYVLPSYSEAFNCSYIEAWGCGVSIIGCKGVSIQEVLRAEDQDRYLIVPRDSDELAQKILWVYRNRPARQILTKDLDIDALTRLFVDWIDGRRLTCH